MRVACNRMRAQALQTSKKKERKLLVAYVETGTNSYLKYIPKVLQDPLKGKESR